MLLQGEPPRGDHDSDEHRRILQATMIKDMPRQRSRARKATWTALQNKGASAINQKQTSATGASTPVSHSHAPRPTCWGVAPTHANKETNKTKHANKKEWHLQYGRCQTQLPRLYLSLRQITRTHASSVTSISHRRPEENTIDQKQTPAGNPVQPGAYVPVGVGTGVRTGVGTGVGTGVRTGVGTGVGVAHGVIWQYMPQLYV